MTLTSPGGTDTLKCSYVWNTGRQVDDQLVLQYSVNAGNPISWDTVNGATAKTYSPANVTPTGGGATPTYTVDLLTKHNEGGVLTQKVKDTIDIGRPDGVAIDIGAPFAKKLNKTQFYLIDRVQGKNNDTEEYTLNFSVWNPATGGFDPQGGVVTVAAGSTTFHTYLLTLNQATYIYQLQGVDAVKIRLQMANTNGKVVASQSITVSVQDIKILQPPGAQNGSLPFDNGSITVKVQPDSSFEYAWDLGEQLNVYVEWSVNPTGSGTLDLQISWYNTATGAWELLFEATDAVTGGGASRQAKRATSASTTRTRF